MKINSIPKKISVVLTVAVYLALIRTIADPLIGTIGPHDLRVLLMSSLFMAVSCLAITILTMASKPKVSSLVAAGTLVALVITKVVWLH